MMHPVHAGLLPLLCLLLPACPKRSSVALDIGPDAGSDAPLADSQVPDGPVGDGRCRVSMVAVTSSGQRANATRSHTPVISRDGRFVAFVTEATNLHPGAPPGVYLRDLSSQTTTLLSVDNNGAPVSASGSTSISDDGRYVAFSSNAKNLGVTGYAAQLFRRDRLAGLTEMLSVSSAGIPASADWGANGRLSGDGQHAVLYTGATNLVPGDTNTNQDVFLRDIAASTTVRVSVKHDGSECDGHSGAPSISHDGACVFSSSCALVPNVTAPSNITMADVRDAAGTLTLVSTSQIWGASTGQRPIISGDGTLVAYLTRRDPDTDATMPHYTLYLHHTTTGQHTRLTYSVTGGDPDGDITVPAMSPNGRYISFSSRATDLVPGGTPGWFDAYRLDLQTGTIVLVSVDRQGQRLDASHDIAENHTSVADDGSVVFDAYVKDCVPGKGASFCVYLYQGCD